MSEPPRRNAAGRPIWFRASTGVDGGGVYRPVTGQGCAVFAAAMALVLVSGAAMMAAIALMRQPAALLVGFVPLAIGLLLVARTVARHS